MWGHCEVNLHGEVFSGLETYDACRYSVGDGSFLMACGRPALGCPSVEHYERWGVFAGRYLAFDASRRIDLAYTCFSSLESG